MYTAADRGENHLSPELRIIFSVVAFIKNKNKRLRRQEYKIKLFETEK